jgi:hypothetical protein
MNDFKSYRFAISHAEDGALAAIGNAARKHGATDVFVRLRIGVVDSIVVDGISGDDLESISEIHEALESMSYTRRFTVCIDDEHRDDGKPCSIITFK